VIEFFRKLSRAVEILVVLARRLLLPSLLRGRWPRPGPVELRLILEHLGGTWIKLGQVMSMRFDLLPRAYCQELLKLLNDVRPFPYEFVRDIIREDLGGPPEQLFALFEPVPFASASIGQVHRAELPSGETVAVKVQRPNARRIFKSDIQLMYAVSGLLDWFGLFGSTPSRRLIDEFAGWVANELDYSTEARQGEQLRENAAADPLQIVPLIYRSHSSSRVMTMELVEGVPLIEIMFAVSSENAGYLDALRAMGHDLARIVRHIDWNLMNQIHVDGYFHADLHPANILILPGDVIAYVDFGIVGKLGEATRESLTRYAWHFFRGDTDRAISELARWIAPAGRTSYEFTKAELARIHDEFIDSFGRADQPGPATSSFAMAILEVIRRHGLVLSPDVMTYFRSLIMADTIRTQLAPDYDLQSDVHRFFARLVAQQTRAWADPRRFVHAAYEYGHRLSRVLDVVEAQHVTAGVIEQTLMILQSRVLTARRRIRTLVVLVLAAGAALAVALQYPNLRTAGPLPSEGADWIPPLIVTIIAVLIVLIVIQQRSLRRASSIRYRQAGDFILRQ
jgi:ubiquinone biosynthesis protein